MIGNGTIGALITPDAEIVWACFPRFDGDPVFCRLLRGEPADDDTGFAGIELDGCVSTSQAYQVNTAILVTRMVDHRGSIVEVTDFAPHFIQHGRVFSPMMLVRLIRRVAGKPRIRVRVRPAYDYGRHAATKSVGSSHIRYLGGEPSLRLTTDAPITMMNGEYYFGLTDDVTLMLGPDESVAGDIREIGRRFLAETQAYWREWVRSLAIPFEWQEAVIRAAITLKLNVFEDTGAIIAAMTTSIPEATGSARNWDYRFCWLRDAYFVVNALNRLGATRTMERYLRYILDILAGATDAVLVPMYDLGGQPVPAEEIVLSLPGYRGMGPVRRGNQAALQLQNDVYGSAILAVAHVFFDARLVQGGDAALFESLEPLGTRAVMAFDQPDAGIWELRSVARIHTYSSVMCWAACDRLAAIADRLGLTDRAAHWTAQAERMHRVISDRCWNAERNAFVATMDGDQLDASLLRLHELGFLEADDPRFIGTVRAIQRDLQRGDFIFRYVERDDFGMPENAFLVCTFWYINALADIGELEEARRLFGVVLDRRNRHGLLAEHVDPATGEQWGNFVQTYSMVGLIDVATRLSVPWTHWI